MEESIKDVPEFMQNALNAAHNKLSKYYSKMTSPLYVIAVLLDPRLKDKYLIREKYEELYPKEFKKAKDELIKLMSNVLVEENKTNNENVKSPDKSVAKKKTNPIFASLYCSPNNINIKSPEKELTDYFNENLSSGDVDVLEYWKNNVERYPRLAAVAKIILSTPGTSVSVERVFNVGRDTISL